MYSTIIEINIIVNYFWHQKTGNVHKIDFQKVGQVVQADADDAIDGTRSRVGPSVHVITIMLQSWTTGVRFF